MALLRPVRPRTNLSADTAVPGPGPVPFSIETTGTARTAEHVASHRKRRYSRSAGPPSARRDPKCDYCVRTARSSGSSARPHAVMRSEITARSCGLVEDARVGDGLDACRRRRRCRRRRPRVRRPGGRSPRWSRRAGGQAVRDQVGEELLVALLVLGDPADQVLEHGLVDQGLQVAAEHGVRALEERHEHQRLDLAVGVGAVALHHVLDADVLVGRRIDLTGHDEVVAQRDRVQVLLGGPAADEAAPLLVEDEVLDEFAVIAGEVVLRDQQDLEGVGDGLGQRDVRRVPVPATEEREVLALVARHEVVARTTGLRCRGGASCSRSTTGSSSEDQRIRNGFQCHESNCNPSSHVLEIGCPRVVTRP